MWPVLVINLNRSKERLDKMEKLFSQENLMRIEAIDGIQWSSGSCDKEGKPLFNKNKLSSLYKQGILGRKALDRWPIIPAEVGCSLSHLKVWEYIIEKEIPWTIVLEDDIKPTPYLKGTLQESIEKQFKVPDDAEVIFLAGANNPWNAVVVDSQNKFIKGYGTFAYAISLRGALRAYRAMTPMYFPIDIQWFARAFKEAEIRINSPLLEIERGQAYGLSYGLIDVSEENNISTMTPNGKKPWKTLPWNRHKKESGLNVNK